MVKIANLVCSESTNAKPDGLILENPVAKIMLDSLPNNYSFFVTFSIVDLCGDVTTDDYVHISLKSSQEIEIFNSKVQLPTPEDLDVPLDNNLTGNFLLNNIKFSSTGLYTLEVSSNLCESARTYFYVEKNSY
ncbi:TPA: hypothetical protein I0H43_RS14135 [Enterococcus faecalis]|nr:hypothetical protein [Enterococcus faecalis]